MERSPTTITTSEPHGMEAGQLLVVGRLMFTWRQAIKDLFTLRWGDIGYSVHYTQHVITGVREHTTTFRIDENV